MTPEFTSMMTASVTYPPLRGQSLIRICNHQTPQHFHPSFYFWLMCHQKCQDPRVMECVCVGVILWRRWEEVSDRL